MMAVARKASALVPIVIPVMRMFRNSLGRLDDLRRCRMIGRSGRSGSPREHGKCERNERCNHP